MLPSCGPVDGVQRLCHPETALEEGNGEINNCLPLLKISLIENTSSDEKDGSCHLESVVKLVQGLCYAATK
jgi:hypothetical protein